MESLTDDVLGDVLRRLPPRSLAVSRCVCTSWRALIDGDGLLRADLLPHYLAGLVICYHDLEFGRAMLLARPGVGSGDYDIPGRPVRVLDHCNGLLLFYCTVLNPATGRHATFPERVVKNMDYIEYEFLAFDPTVSSHYQVVMVPYIYPYIDVDGGGVMSDSEWPPSPWILTVFSSATGRWEERPFIRRGEPAGTVAELLPQCGDWRDDGHAVYWKGTLYVHCETNFVMRISLSDGTYRVIKPPRHFGDDQEFVIGRSEKGIYSAFLDDKYHRLWIWTLDESCDTQIEWKLRHDSGRAIAFPSPSFGRGPWMLYEYDHGSRQEGDEALVDRKSEWNSDSDDDGNTIQQTGDTAEERRGFLPYKEIVFFRMSEKRIMAFHPYKEIVFFHMSEKRLMAYHLSSSKLEDLGKLSPAIPKPHEYIRNYFPFTPCYMGELPG